MPPTLELLLLLHAITDVELPMLLVEKMHDGPLVSRQLHSSWHKFGKLTIVPTQTTLIDNKQWQDCTKNSAPNPHGKCDLSQWSSATAWKFIWLLLSPPPLPFNCTIYLYLVKVLIDGLPFSGIVGIGQFVGSKVIIGVGPVIFMGRKDCAQVRLITVMMSANGTEPLLVGPTVDAAGRTSDLFATIAQEIRMTN